jgi:serine protease
VAAIRYAADQGAKIINLSLGGRGRAQAELDAVRYAVQRGAFLAIAAGNEFEEGNPASYPAAFAPEVDGAMSVGAVGPTARRAYYSNTGAYLEIAAPGGDDRVGGNAAMVVQAGLSRNGLSPFQASPRFNEYVVHPDLGTSMAAPHVAGLAALLYSQGVTSPAAIEAAIKRFAVDLGPPGRDDEYGHGLIDARATLRGLGVAR